MLAVMHGASRIDYALMRFGASFLKVYGGTVTFNKTGVSFSKLGEAISQSLVNVNEQSGGTKITSASVGPMWAAHELFHTFNYALHPNTTDGSAYGQGIIDLALEGVSFENSVGDLIKIAGNTTQSYANDDFYVNTSHGYRPGINPQTSGPYRQNNSKAVTEDYANMGPNWAFNSFANNDAGRARYNFMESHMAAWISLAVTNNQ